MEEMTSLLETSPVELGNSFVKALPDVVTGEGHELHKTLINVDSVTVFTVALVFIVCVLVRELALELLVDVVLRGSLLRLFPAVG